MSYWAKTGSVTVITAARARAEVGVTSLGRVLKGSFTLRVEMERDCNLPVVCCYLSEATMAELQGLVR